MVTGGILIAIITGGFAYIAGKNSDMGTFVTQQREDWREYLRNWVERMTVLVSKYDMLSDNDTDSCTKIRYFNKINKSINSLIVRLNPTRDYMLINYLLNFNQSIDKKNLVKTEEDNTKKSEYSFDMNLVTFYISKLLKNDWERVKNNNSLLGHSWYLDVVFILGFGFYGIQTIEYIFRNYRTLTFEMFMKNNVIESLTFLIFIYVVLKILYKLLMKSELFRLINFNDIFNHNFRFWKHRVYNFLPIRNIELILAIIYVFIITNLKSFLSLILNENSFLIYVCHHWLWFLIVIVYIILLMLKLIFSTNERLDEKNTEYGYKVSFFKVESLGDDKK